MQIIKPIDLFSIHHVTDDILADGYVEYPLSFIGENQDVARIPMLPYKGDDELNDSAMKLVIQTCLDRNIIVYDSEKTGPSTRLLSLMSSVYRNNKRPVFPRRPRKYVVDSRDADELEDMLAANHLTESYKGRIFQMEIDDVYYRWFEDELKGTLPQWRLNFMFVVGLPDSLVCPVIYDGNKIVSYGLGILDNKEVLLGAV